MNEIDIIFRCGNRFCEIPSNDVSTAESVVEEMSALTLITIFEHVKMQEVSVSFPSASARADDEIVLSIRAQGFNPLPSLDLAHLDCAIEDRLSCALVELFGMLNVERCAVGQ